jgi:c(7)-type cytochrome triheme protein
VLPIVLALVFDHATHDAKMAVAGASSPACAACHDGARTRCRGCHAPKPFGAGGHDFSLIFPHDEHERCETCHLAPPAKRKGAPHARCQECHKTNEACTGCHQQVAGRDLTPHMPAAATPVRFSHATHEKSCLPCHQAVTGAKGEIVPRPAMQTCERCHDGKAAFAALVGCRRCHDRDDPNALPSPAPVRGFEHSAHLARGMKEDCAACHVLDADGRPRPVPHPACTSCHAADFRTSQPTTCGACHVGNEPWRPLRADAPRRLRTEFGAIFSHAGHTVGECKTCHTGIPGGPERRIGVGHAACAACHQQTAPALAACTGCHQLGLLPQRDTRRVNDPWSAAMQFRHDSNHAIACARCHPTAAAARTVDVIETPKKPACEGCHEGKTAFKMTGHDCAGCHAR